MQFPEKQMKTEDREDSLIQFSCAHLYICTQNRSRIDPRFSENKPLRSPNAVLFVPPQAHTKARNRSIVKRCKKIYVKIKVT